MAVRHFCDCCGVEGPPGNGGIQQFLIMCLGPGEQTNRPKGHGLDICPKCAENLHLSVEIPDDY